MDVVSGWIFLLRASPTAVKYVLPRYLVLHRGTVSMYASDISKEESEDAPASLTGFVGEFFKIEELGRTGWNGQDFYMCRVCSKLDHTKEATFGCLNPRDVQQWVGAFQQAREECLALPLGQSGRSSSYSKNQGTREGRQVKIGPDWDYVQKTLQILSDELVEAMEAEVRGSDVLDFSSWQLFRIDNGLRFFLDSQRDVQAKRGTVVKAVGVVGAPASAVFQLIMDLNDSTRNQWDPTRMIMRGVESINGHHDIISISAPSTYNRPSWWRSLPKKSSEVLVSRLWRINQDSSYTIATMSSSEATAQARLQDRSLNVGVWEISPLSPKTGIGVEKCLVSVTYEVSPKRWTAKNFKKLPSTSLYLLFSRIAGIREYFEARMSMEQQMTMVSEIHTRSFDVAIDTASPTVHHIQQHTMKRLEKLSTQKREREEFYDALASYSPENEEEEMEKSVTLRKHLTFRQAALSAVFSLSSGKEMKLTGMGRELDVSKPAVKLDAKQFQGSLPRSSVRAHDSWDEPLNDSFMVRGPTYMTDQLKIKAGAPLLRLMAVDWMKSAAKVDHVAAKRQCIVQSPEGKRSPFILVCNLQVPASPNYSIVFYFVAEHPIHKPSLLDSFVNGNDNFRNARLKLIPNIVEGNWVVKRAVGSKACLLGRALTCNYHRHDNYLELDVDIGSSSVARGVIGVVLGYVTGLVIDMGILIQGESEDELPEYLLGSMRIDHLKVSSAIDAWTE